MAENNEKNTIEKRLHCIYKVLKDNDRVETIGTEISPIKMFDEKGELNIPEEDRDRVVSLAILPVYNKGEKQGKPTLYTGAKDISKYIYGFKNLKKIVYPAQFVSINPALIQKNNAGTDRKLEIMRVIPQEHELETEPIKVRGTVTHDSMSLDLDGFADLISGTVVDTMTVDPKKVRAKSTYKKPNLVTNEYLDEKIAPIMEKLYENADALNEVESIVSNINATANSIKTKTKYVAQLATKENIRKIFNSAIGRMTEEEIKPVLDEINSKVTDLQNRGVSENFEQRVMGIISTEFGRIRNAEKQKENERFDELAKSIEEIRTSQLEDNEKQQRVLGLLADKYPQLIATNKNFTEKLLPKLGGMEAKMDMANENIADYVQILSDEIEDLGAKLKTSCENVNLGDDAKAYIEQTLNIFANGIASKVRSGNDDLLEKIQAELSKTVTADQIEKIVEEKLTEFGVENDRNNVAISKFFAHKITDTVINSIDGLQDKTSADIKFIENSIENIFNQENFQEKLNIVFKDSDLAKTQNINDIESLIKRNHKEELETLDRITLSIAKMPTLKDMQELTKAYSDGLFRSIVMHDAKNNNELKETILSSNKDLDEKLDEILAECKKKGMTTDDLKGFISSKEGRDVLADALNITGIKAELGKTITTAINSEQQQVLQNQQEMIARLNGLEEAYKNLVATNLNVYTGSLGFARATVLNGGTVASGYNPVILQPYDRTIIQRVETENERRQNDISVNQIDLNTIINQAVKVAITSTLQIVNATNGVGKTENLNATDTAKAVGEELNKKIKEKDEIIAKQQKEIAELKNQVKDLNNKLDLVLKKLEEKENSTDKPEETEKKTPVEKDTKNDKDKKPDDKRKVVVPPVKEVKQVANIKDIPEAEEENFIKYSISRMEKLAEPKLSVAKRFGKWVKRHPLAITAIGLGAGAVIGAGVGTISAGGVGAMISKAGWFVPTLQTIGIGAGVGLGLGAIGEVVARVTGLGGRDKLYAKFMKEKAKCEKMKEKLEELDKQIEMTNEVVNETRENLRTGKVKSTFICRKAHKFNLNSLRVLKQKARIQNSEYKQQIEKFLKAKKELNEMEDATGKTMAMAGSLQKLRDAEAKFEQDKLDAGNDKEKLHDAEEDFKAEKEVIELEAPEGIAKLDKNFKTGDKEAEDIIKSVKGKKSDAMTDMLKDIEKRSLKRKSEVVKVKKYSAEKFEKYRKLVEEKGNEIDKRNLQDLINKIKKVNSDASKKINEENLISQKDLEEFEVEEGIRETIEKDDNVL